jgi:hypothetical protein
MDFDQQGNRGDRLKRPRSFRLGGEEIHFLSGLPAVVMRDVVALERDYMKRQEEDVDSLTAVDLFEHLKEKGRLFLARESLEAWDRALSPDRDDPVTVNDLGDVVAWLTEQVAGVPTMPPTSSSAGQETSGESLTAASSSPVST